MPTIGLDLLTLYSLAAAQCNLDVRIARTIRKGATLRHHGVGSVANVAANHEGPYYVATIAEKNFLIQL